ncbi:MAG: hypothetical protein QM703_08145 [Gemmatales bacterium]
MLRAPTEEKRAGWMEARLDADLIVHGQEVLARYEIDVQRWHARLRLVTLDVPENLLIKSLSMRQFGTDLPLAYKRVSATTMEITFPESVEQRATIVMETSWNVRKGDRIVFQTPSLRGDVSVKPTIRVVSMPAEPWSTGTGGITLPNRWSLKIIQQTC